MAVVTPLPIFFGSENITIPNREPGLRSLATMRKLSSESMRITPSSPIVTEELDAVNAEIASRTPLGNSTSTRLFVVISFTAVASPSMMTIASPASGLGVSPAELFTPSVTGSAVTTVVVVLDVDVDDVEVLVATWAFCDG